MRPAKFSNSHWAGIAASLFLLPFLIALSPVLLLTYLGRLARALLINFTAWYAWRRQGKYVLIVYSDSTIWKDYFESELLPQVADRAIVLNWSQKRRWPWSIAALAFRHYAGRVEFNPAAFVFRPFKRVKVLRYYVPFKEYKRGRPDSVEALTEQLMGLLESANVQQAA